MTTVRPAKRGRSLFDIVPGRHRPKTLRVGAIFAAVTIVFLWIIYTRPTLIPSGGTELKAVFADGVNVRPGYTPVRVAGVEVGQVTGIEKAPAGRGVLVTMKIEDGKGVDLRRDASANLRWRTLLGRNIYVDVDPGSRSAPRLGDRVIPKSRTGGQVELDEALEPFDADGRRALRTLFGEFDRGFGDPDAIGRTIESVEPSLRELAPGVRALRGTRHGDLTDLVRSTSRAMGALSRDEVALGRFISGGRVTLGVTAARRADLGATLDGAPAAMRETRATMARVRTTLDVLDPVAKDLRPGARRLAPAARHARTMLTTAVPLLRDARATLNALRPTLPDLRRAADAGTPTLRGFAPTFDRTNSTLLPWLNARNPENKLKNFQQIGPALATAASATSWGDSLGAVANFEAGAGESVVASSPCKTRATDPTAKPEELIACELISRALVSALTGVPPDSKRLMRGSTVPMKRLEPLLNTRKRGR